MTDKAEKTILIKWVRSGIGFSHLQKDVLRSLGLRRPNHVVERPDTPQIRGLAAKIPHLVEVVGAQTPPAWASVPEYTILPPEEGAPKPATKKGRPVVELSESAAAVEAAPAEVAPTGKAGKPSKGAESKKAGEKSKAKPQESKRSKKSEK